MKKYLFTDVDDVTDEVIDIKGEEYAKLIDRLFQYEKSFHCKSRLTVWITLMK